MRRALCLVAVASVLAAEPARLSLEDLFRFFAESLTVEATDSEVAETLAHATFAPVPTGSVEVLQSLGAGPLTLQVMERASNKSAVAAPAAPYPALGPAPDPARVTELMNQIRSYAARYVHALPDFLCTQTSRYYQSGRLSKGSTKRGGDSSRIANWHLDQTITEQVRYHDGAEEYTTKFVNGQPDETPITEIRDSYSRGEFGGVLEFTFEPASQATFAWDHWDVTAGKRVAVLRYSVSRTHSQYRVCCLSVGSMTLGGVRRRQLKTWISAYQGWIYADPDSGVIVRFSYRNVDIPAESNLDDARNLVEYTPVTAGGRTGWLPGKVIHYTRQGAFRTRSESVFSNYRGFGATSTLQFPADDKP